MKIVLIIIVLIISPVLLFADGIWLKNIGMEQLLRKSADFILILSVYSINGVKGFITAKVKKEITNNQTYTGNRNIEPQFNTNDVYQFDIVPPPAYEKHKWVVEERYWNLLTLDRIKAGDEIIAVPENGAGHYEFIKGDEINIQKITFFSEGNAGDKLIKLKDKEILEKLGDFDYFAPACEEAKKRKILNDQTLLNALAGMPIPDAAENYLSKLTNRHDKENFLHHMVQYNKKKKNTMMNYFLYNNLFYSIGDVNIDDALEFYWSMNNADKEELRLKRDGMRAVLWYYADQKPANYMKLYRAILDFIMIRQEFHEEKIDDYTGLLSDSEKEQFVLDALPLLTKTAWAKERKIDDYLLDILVRRMKENPSIKYPDELLKLYPSLPVDNESAGALLGALAVQAEKIPQSKDKVKKLASLYKKKFPRAGNDKEWEGLLK